MAINFLNNVNFNSIQSENIVIENFATDILAGNGVSGQIYWNTTSEELRGWDGNAGAWVSIGSDNDVLTFTGGSGGNQTVLLKNQTFSVAGTTNQIVTTGSAQTITLSFPTSGVTLPNGSVATTQASADDSTKVATTAFVKTAVAASDTLAEVLAIGNTTSGTNIAVTSSDDITFVDNSKAIFGSGGDLEIFHSGAGSFISEVGNGSLYIQGESEVRIGNPLPANAAGEIYARFLSNSYSALYFNNTERIRTTNTGVQFVNGTISDNAGNLGATGQYLASNGTVLAWTAIPIDPNEKYTLPVTAIAGNNAEVSLTGSTDGVVSTVNFIGTTSRIALTSNDQNNGSITIDFPDDVTIVDDLTVGGIIVQQQNSLGDPVEKNTFAAILNMNNNKVENVKTGTLGTDGVNLAQVEALVAGLGSFQGGYNAATNSPALSGSSNVAVGNGDFYVVTNPGTLFTKVLEVGDFIFANTNIPANSSPAESDYIFIISDANIAGAGATDSGTQKGVAGFDSANFTVSANGWVQIKPLSRLNGRKQTLNDGGSAAPATSPVTRTFLNGLTTFEIDLADNDLFGTGALAEDVTVEVMQDASPYQTVYADVTRSGSASMSIIFSGNVAVDTYRVLLEYV